MSENILNIFIKPDSTIHQAIKKLNRNAKGIALVTDQQRHLLGTITDGDIRRAILAGNSLDTPVANILAEKAESLYSKPITALVGTEPPELLNLMKMHVIQQLPIVDADGCVVDLILLEDLLPEPQLPLQAVIMAGGFGSRLNPLTNDVPKPMLPIGNRPLMEYTIEQLRRVGIQQINISTHYLPEKIVEHFGDGTKFGVNINYVNEEQPLGTAGALGLLDAPNEPFLVINGDILTRVNFRAMLNFHHKQDADLTVGVRQYEMEVPYGVLECDGPHVVQLSEKPRHNFLVNAGIYLLESSVHRYIPTGKHFNMTDLIGLLIDKGRTVVSFPILEYWLDVGQHADYMQAQKDIIDGSYEK